MSAEAMRASYPRVPLPMSVEHLLHNDSKRLYIVSTDGVDNLSIQIKIVMTDDVAHPHHPFPFDGWVLGQQISLSYFVQILDTLAQRNNCMQIASSFSMPWSDLVKSSAQVMGAKRLEIKRAAWRI